MIGKRLVLLRKNRDLTQDQIAKIFNMSRSTYAQYEVDRRNPDYATLKMFAEYFIVTTDYLLGFSDDPKLKQVTDPEMLKELEEAKKAMDEAADRYLKILEKHSFKQEISPD